MQGNLKHAIELTFGHEGGLSLDRKDPGNWTGGKVGLGRLVGTKYGIAAHSHPNLDIPNLTLEKAAEILDDEYWRKAWGDRLPAGVDYAVFDYAVNSGVGQAIKDLQRVVGTNTDSSMGPKTLAAVNAMPAPTVIRGLMDRRLILMQKLENWEHNKNGWTKRVNKVREAALDMTSIAPATVASFTPPLALLSSEASAPAKPTDVLVSRTKQGKASITALVGSVAVSAPALVATMTTYQSTPWVAQMLPYLAFAGALAAIIGSYVGIKIEQNHIAGGSPQ